MDPENETLEEAINPKPNTPDQQSETDQETPVDTPIEEDPIVGNMISELLGKTTETTDIKPAEDEADEQGEAKGGDESKVESTETPKDDNGGLKVLATRKSIQEQIQEEVARQQAESSKQTSQAPSDPAPKAAPEIPAPVEDQQVVLENLSDEEQDYYELLQYAAQSKKDQYKGELEKFVSFAKKRNQMRDKILSEDPDADLSDHDSLQRFTDRNRPTLPRREIKAIERMQIVAEAQKQVKEQYDEKFQTLEANAKKAELEPEVSRQSSEFEADLITVSKDASRFDGDKTIPDLIEVMEKEGVEAAKESNPLFAEIIESTINQHNTAAKEFVKLTKYGEQGMNVYDDKNPAHRWLLEFINQNDSRFLQANTPKKIRTVDGIAKNFATQQSFVQMSPEEQARHWTFSPEERLKIIQANAILHMKQSVTTLREKLKKAGWTQQQINQQLGSQTTKGNNKSESPKVKQSLSSGATTTRNPPKKESVMKEEELAALGIG